MMPLARLVVLAILLFFTIPATIGSMILAVIAPFALLIWLPILLIGFGIDVGIGYYIYKDFRNRRSDRRDKEYFPMSI